MVSGNDLPSLWTYVRDRTLLPPPPGVQPDFAHRKWYGGVQVITASVGVTLMVLFASIRVYVKCFHPRKWTLDDWMFLISLCSGIILISLELSLTLSPPTGYHGWEVRLSELTLSHLKRNYTLLLAGPLFTWLVKLGMFSLIYFSFNPVTYIRWLVYMGVGITGPIYITCTIVGAVVCRPRVGSDRMGYLLGIAQPQCSSPSGTTSLISIIQGSVNVACDFYLFFIPLWEIKKLNLPTKRKVQVFVVFLAGLGACIMSILALMYRRRAYRPDDHATNYDSTYTNVLIFAVTTIEASVGVIIPCVPSFAKACSYVSNHIRIYTSTKFSAYRRTASKNSELTQQENGEVHPHVNAPPAKKKKDTDTIDRMLGQFRISRNSAAGGSQSGYVEMEEI